MQVNVPLTEIQDRLCRFREIMDNKNPDWEIAVIFSKINLYYFTGTMQDGMLLIPRNNDAVFWVRRSYERACIESAFPEINNMESFREAAAVQISFPAIVYLETEFVPLALLQRFQKYFPFISYKAADNAISITRSVKSAYEISWMKQAGKIHARVLEDCVPAIVKEGMSEADFAFELYALLVKEGHQGHVRFGMFDTEMVVGQIAFGDNSLYPTSFNGPGGNLGLSPASPFLGNRDRKLHSGDLIFFFFFCGMNGYHTDKTMTYMFGRSLPKEAIAAHRRCVEIQNEMASMLVPGAIPSEIYRVITDQLSSGFIENFMGFGNRQVKFLGHGIGLTVDETPVIAAGFDDPITEGMVFALEPKKGIKNIGMVGIENTFMVTPLGGKSITGNSEGLIPIY